MARRAPRNARTDPPATPQRLWAPWRHAYVTASGPRPAGCIFCFERLSPAAQRRRLILHAAPLGLVMLNRYPYNSGHLMVAPRRHVASPELLTRVERLALDDLIAHAVVQLRESMHPGGINLGANLGKVAGAGIADHMHWHLVPRWEGDTNFMPVISATRVLSQRLEEAFDLLAPRFKAIETALS